MVCIIREKIVVSSLETANNGVFDPLVLLTVDFLFSREDFQTSACRSQIRQKNDRQKNTDYDGKSFCDSFFCHQFFCCMCSCVIDHAVLMARLHQWVAGEARAV
jgi:hypothetical protein